VIINIWLGISDAAQNVVRTALQWDEEAQGPYTGPLTNKQRRLFEYMQDETTRRQLFKKATLAGTTYILWSIDFDDSVTVLQLIRDEIDGLMAEYPNQIAVLGAWHFEEGAQVGTRSGGNPVYPIPAFLWRFMPDDEDGNPTATSNADLTDINLLYGQAPRAFS